MWQNEGAFDGISFEFLVAAWGTHLTGYPLNFLWQRGVGTFSGPVLMNFHIILGKWQAAVDDGHPFALY